MFTMPGNYANRTIPAEANARLVDRMRQHVAAFAQDVLAGKAMWPQGYPLWSNALTKLSRSPRPWRFFKNVYPLAVDADRCTRCGLCAKLCPVGCIRMQDLPVWSDECESCQRCIGYCPAHAIHVPGKPAAQYTAAPLDALLGE
jgi:ferredoxin